jgi:hypothetical protein
MPPIVPHRTAPTRSPTITSGLLPLNWHDVLQHEFAVPFDVPSSHASPGLMVPSPHAASAWDDDAASAKRKATEERAMRAWKGQRRRIFESPARMYDNMPGIA